MGISCKADYCGIGITNENTKGMRNTDIICKNFNVDAYKKDKKVIVEDAWGLGFFKPAKDTDLGGTNDIKNIGNFFILEYEIEKNGFKVSF